MQEAEQYSIKDLCGNAYQEGNEEHAIARHLDALVHSSIYMTRIELSKFDWRFKQSGQLLKEVEIFTESQISNPEKTIALTSRTTHGGY